MSIVRTIKVVGFDVDIMDFGTQGKYMYPKFNGNAEYELTRDGYKRLNSWLRSILYIEALFNYNTKE